MKKGTLINYCRIVWKYICLHFAKIYYLNPYALFSHQMQKLLCDIYYLCFMFHLKSYRLYRSYSSPLVLWRSSTSTLRSENTDSRGRTQHHKSQNWSCFRESLMGFARPLYFMFITRNAVPFAASFVERFGIGISHYHYDCHRYYYMLPIERRKVKIKNPTRIRWRCRRQWL